MRYIYTQIVLTVCDCTSSGIAVPTLWMDLCVLMCVRVSVCVCGKMITLFLVVCSLGRWIVCFFLGEFAESAYSTYVCCLLACVCVNERNWVVASCLTVNGVCDMSYVYDYVAFRWTFFLEMISHMFAAEGLKVNILSGFCTFAHKSFD